MEEKDKNAASDVVNNEPIYRTAADIHNIGNDSPPPTPGLSIAPGLREVPNSQAPAMADGSMVAHVYGPGQAPVDPIAAGLDTKHVPLTRAENRVITQTGELGAGPRPTTYVEKGMDTPQAGPSDGANVPAQSDEVSAAAPGPNSGNPTEAAKAPNPDANKAA